MGFSTLFIRRPIATSLLMAGVLLLGILGYRLLPVSALPDIDAPSIQVTTQYPGASPSTMASLVTTPLERQFGQISGLRMMTSDSSAGLSTILLTFNMDRDIDAAAQDVQSAINAGRGTLPNNLPYPPVYNKVNPADAPILTLVMSSDALALLLLLAFHRLVDLRRALGQQEQAAGQHDHVPPGDRVFEHREHRLGQAREPDGARQQQHPHAQGQQQADALGHGPLVLRQTAGGHCQEDQIVDPQHDFQRRQRQQSGPDFAAQQDIHRDTLPRQVL